MVHCNQRKIYCCILMTNVSFLGYQFAVFKRTHAGLAYKVKRFRTDLAKRKLILKYCIYNK